MILGKYPIFIKPLISSWKINWDTIFLDTTAVDKIFMGHWVIIVQILQLQILDKSKKIKSVSFSASIVAKQESLF